MVKKKSKYIHCKKCGRSIAKRRLGFKKRMAKTRKHYKRFHSGKRKGTRKKRRRRKKGGKRK